MLYTSSVRAIVFEPFKVVGGEPLWSDVGHKIGSGLFPKEDGRCDYYQLGCLGWSVRVV